jgi:hypothetical protein
MRVQLERFRQNPHRFRVSQDVFVYGWSQEFSVRIVKILDHYRWPVYEIEEWNGDKWEVSQLLLSRKPIQNRYEATADS